MYPTSCTPHSHRISHIGRLSAPHIKRSVRAPSKTEEFHRVETYVDRQSGTFINVPSGGIIEIETKLAVPPRSKSATVILGYPGP